MSTSHLINKCAAWVEFTAGLFLAAVTLLIFISAGARYLWSSPIPDAHAFASLLLGVSLLWGLASASWRDEHISVDLLYLRFPKRLQKVVDVIGQVLILTFVTLFCWMLLRQVGSVQESGEMTVDTQTVIWPFYAVAWGGVAASVMLILARIWLLLFNTASLPSKKSVSEEAAENAEDIS